MNPNIDYEVLNNALDVAIETGDGWIKVAQLELSIEYPHLRDKDFVYIETLCKLAIKDCYDFPYLVKHTDTWSQKVAERDLYLKFLGWVQDTHSWIDDSNRDKLYHRTRYLAFHDGII